MTSRINPRGENRIAKALALVDRGLAMLDKDTAEENLRETVGLFQEAKQLLQEEHEAGSGGPWLSQAITDLEPILFKFGIALDWDHRN